jgi:hypothetical protein
MTGALVTASLFLLTQPAEPQSAYTYLDEARGGQCGPASPVGSEGQDAVEYRCSGYEGVTVWVIYCDGVRMGLAFGARPESCGYLLTERNADWPIEWRHTGSRPYAAIARVRLTDFGEPARITAPLAVYGLELSGRSCLIGQARSNSEARLMADGFASRRHCPPNRP